MNRELAQWILSGENWLMGRILHYAKRQGYSRYTSTLEEAWRISIHELSAALVRAIDGYPEVIEFEADETFDGDPICEFALLEADRHRQRGIPLTMFLGLFKYYRQAYLDRVAEATWDDETSNAASLFVQRIFDRLEIAYCGSWAALNSSDQIRELQDTNRRMTNEKNRFLTVTESLGSPVIHLDENESIIYANTTAMTALGVEARPGMAYYDRQSLDLPTPSWLAEASAAAEQRGEIVESECRVETEQGPRIYAVRAHPMLDVSDKFLGTVVALHDITELRRAGAALEARARDLEQLSLTDPLTGLLNRRGLLTFGEKHLAIARRGGRPLTILYGDLDDLKAINDQHGHAAGDAALVAFAAALRLSFREADILARVGGDEFVVVMADSVDAAGRELVKRMKTNLVRALANAHQGLRISFTAGSAEFDAARHETLDQLVEEADRAMYEAKRRRAS
jgi:diguanylate cyclase (GGDEF)-like protein